MRRVVVTGIGVAAPNGVWHPAYRTVNGSGEEVPENRSFFANTMNGVSTIQQIDWMGDKLDLLPTRVVGRVPHVTEELVKGLFPKKRGKLIRMWGRHTQLGLAASRWAIMDAGLTPESYDPHRFGVCVATDGYELPASEAAQAGLKAIDFSPLINACSNGNGNGEIDDAISNLRVDRAVLMHHLMAEIYPQEIVIKNMPSGAASFITMLEGISGICDTSNNACAAGLVSTIHGSMHIMLGKQDLILAGGTYGRAVDGDYVMMGFGKLGGVLSPSKRPPTEVSRPFDTERDGLVLSEGSTMLVLEDYEHALRRGAHIYGEVAGWGWYSGEEKGITALNSDHIVKAIHEAMEMASAAPEDIGHISAHATSTRQGDPAEAVAIKEALGYSPPVGALKSIQGHMVLAASSTALAMECLCLERRVIFPTINLDRQDPACQDILVPTSADQWGKGEDVSLTIGSAFGGQNVVVALRRFNG